MNESAKELASRGTRLLGAFLDGIILAVAFIPIGMAAGSFSQVTQSQQISISQNALNLVLTIVLFLLINGYLLAKQGQTVGKKLVRIRIVSHVDEHVLPLGKVFCLRYLPLYIVGLLPPLGNLFWLIDVLFIFRKDKRCLHDLIAGTKVVKADSFELEHT